MNANAKNKFFRSLLVVGIFCVLALPALVLGADESFVDASSSPTLISVVDEVIVPVGETPTTPPLVIILPDQTPTSTASSSEATTINPTDLVATSSDNSLSASSNLVGPIIKSMSLSAPLSSLAPSNLASALIAISAEVSASTGTTTCTSNCSNGQIAISDEVGTTSSGNQSGETIISDEYSAQTTVLVGQTVISDEQSATTTDGGSCTENCGSTTKVVSAEYSFTTLNGGSSTGIVVSDEMSFTTLSDGGCTENCGGSTTTVISDEYSFTTLAGDNPPTNIVISDEYSFTTEPTPPNVCTTNCGGGGGGGGGGGYITPIPTVITDQPCGLYLKKYIKFGEANDIYEVKKLQSFLIVFEKETGLKVTGFYDRATFEAVVRFQKKYSRDVLGPWGITDSTGYVFITT
ncbi:MAG: peptidoglycan-binding domain-containing protein, partial [Patescibacteria group bacterium]